MGRNAAALSAVQIAVLRWIVDGRPSSGEDGEGARRISARSLHRRGLMRVRGSGSTWTAAVTPAGRAWLDTHPAATAAAPDGPDDLARRVVEAGGTLDVGGDVAAKVRYEEEARASLHSPDRPRGWKLEVKNAGSWSDPRYQVVLVRHFDDLVDLVPVPVPARVARHHPAVKAYLTDRDHQLVSREHLERAARVLQALADEAPRRAISVQAPGHAARPASDWDARRVDRAHLVLEAPSGTYAIRVRELWGAGGAPVPPRDYRRRSTRAAWLDSRDREFVSTGQLELIVEGPGMAYSGTRLADSKTASLESKLPRLFRAMEIERLVAEHRQQEREREEAERRHRWEAAMAEGGGGPTTRRAGTRSHSTRTTGTPFAVTASSSPPRARAPAALSPARGRPSRPTWTSRSGAWTDSTPSRTSRCSRRRPRSRARATSSHSSTAGARMAPTGGAGSRDLP
jgi:hypothetical protein